MFRLLKMVMLVLQGVRFSQSLITKMRLLFLIGAALFVGVAPAQLWAQEGSDANDPEQQVYTAAVSQQLIKQLAERDGPVSFLAVLDSQPDLPEHSVMVDGKVRAASGIAYAEALYRRLTAHAAATQAPLRAWLEANDIPYRPFYIVNMIEILGDRATVQELSQRSEVARLDANPAVHQTLVVEEESFEESINLSTNRSSTSSLERYSSWLQLLHAEATDASTPRTENVLYGLGYTNAPAVWKLGFKGKGIVVASQDTGVDWGHPALKGGYRGWNQEAGTASHAYNWFDAWGTLSRPIYCSNDPQVPCDDHGHGSHTVGTMVGTTIGNDEPDDDAIFGMAPEAKWIGCRNMRRGVGTPASYAACFQFFLAPYPQDGDPFTDGKPALAPHIINNSWGCPKEEGCNPDTLQQIVQTVRAAGQLIVASAGNKGAQGCATVLDPIAIYDEVFSVGAHDSEGTIAHFSSRGPVNVDESGRAKPDISAPGVNIYSTVPTGSCPLCNPTGYNNASGTSMASPHVAGGAALLWSAAPELIRQIDLTEHLLAKSAKPKLANRCGEGPQEVSPNHTYGYGQLDVLAAIELTQKPAKAEIRALNCDGSALPGVETRIIDQTTGYTYKALTDAAGVAYFPLLYTTEITETFGLNASAGSVQFADMEIPLHKESELDATIMATACIELTKLTVTVTSDGLTSIPGATITLHDQNSSNVYRATTDENSQAIFENVLPGEYVLKSVLNGTMSILLFEDRLITINGIDQQITLSGQRPIFLPIVSNQ